MKGPTKLEREQILSIHKQISAIHRTINTLRGWSSINCSRHNDVKIWGFIPSPLKFLYRFFTAIKAANFCEQPLVLDLGCGVSPVLTMLDEFNYHRAIGYDFDNGLIDVAREFGLDVREGDLLDIAGKMKRTIGQADVIYMYMPIRDTRRYHEVQRNVAKLMKKGAYIVDYHSDYGLSGSDQLLYIESIDMYKKL